MAALTIGQLARQAGVGPAPERVLPQLIVHGRLVDQRRRVDGIAMHRDKVEVAKVILDHLGRAAGLEHAQKRRPSVRLVPPEKP